MLSLCSPRWGDGAHNLPGVPELSHSSLVHPSLIRVSLNNNFSYCAVALHKKPQLKREITLQRSKVWSQKHHCRKGNSWNQMKGAWRRCHLSPWVAEERGCSCEIVSSPYLLDFVAKVSTALVGKRKGEKNLLRTYLHHFFVANRYFFCLHSELLEAVSTSPVQRLIQHITGCDLSKVIKSYILDLQREWELFIW